MEKLLPEIRMIIIFINIYYFKPFRKREINNSNIQTNLIFLNNIFKTFYKPNKQIVNKYLYSVITGYKNIKLFFID